MTKSKFQEACELLAKIARELVEAGRLAQDECNALVAQLSPTEGTKPEQQFATLKSTALTIADKASVKQLIEQSSIGQQNWKDTEKEGKQRRQVQTLASAILNNAGLFSVTPAPALNEKGKGSGNGEGGQGPNFNDDHWLAIVWVPMYRRLAASKEADCEVLLEDIEIQDMPHNMEDAKSRDRRELINQFQKMQEVCMTVFNIASAKDIERTAKALKSSVSQQGKEVAYLEMVPTELKPIAKELLGLDSWKDVVREIVDKQINEGATSQLLRAFGDLIRAESKPPERRRQESDPTPPQGGRNDGKKRHRRSQPPQSTSSISDDAARRLIGVIGKLGDDLRARITACEQETKRLTTAVEQPAKAGGATEVNQKLGQVVGMLGEGLDEIREVLRTTATSGDKQTEATLKKLDQLGNRVAQLTGTVGQSTDAVRDELRRRGTPTPPATPTEEPAPAETTASKPWYKRWWVWLLIVLVLAAAGFGFRVAYPFIFAI